MPRYVYSTLTCNNEYSDFVKNGDQTNVAHTVLVKGGHGVMNKNFQTPLGVVTEVSEEDYEFLKRNQAFQLHMANGFVTLEEKQVDPEKVAANMKRRDKSAQLTPADYGKDGRMGIEEPTVTGGV